MTSLKILELTNYSSGICGVWQRVKQESLELAKKGHDVRIFTTNAVKGTDETAPDTDSLGGVQIQRFPFKKLGGESFMSWNFEREALKFAPNIIIAHSYRHPHTIQALKIKKILKKQGKFCKVFLVTHAPFVENSLTRSFTQSLIVGFYDFFIGPSIINRFDKIISITSWELPFLEKLHIDKNKIVHIPNGIPMEFFKGKRKKGKEALFLGRISPVKNLEILIKAFNNLGINLDIVGPSEEQYKEKLEDIIKNLKINNVFFKAPVYDLKKKISLIDSHEIFILPSKSEAMPQGLIEAMARGKIVVSSNTNGGKEIILDKENGFLFEIGSISGLVETIKKIISLNSSDKKKIQKNAVKTAQKFQWSNLIHDLENIF